MIYPKRRVHGEFVEFCETSKTYARYLISSRCPFAPWTQSGMRDLDFTVYLKTVWNVDKVVLLFRYPDWK